MSGDQNAQLHMYSNGLAIFPACQTHTASNESRSVKGWEHIQLAKVTITSYVYPLNVVVCQ